jgi:hypothetical protein
MSDDYGEVLPTVFETLQSMTMLVWVYVFSTLRETYSNVKACSIVVDASLTYILTELR